MHNCISTQALLHVEEAFALAPYARMADYKSESIAFLRQLIADTGQTPTELARLADVHQTTLTRPLSERGAKSAVKFQTLSRLSERTGVPLPPSLVSARKAGLGPVPDQLALPIRYEVAAGGFLPRNERPQEPFGYRLVTPMPPHEHATQWLERVVSDSMNRRLPPGTLIQVVDAIEIDYRARHGDIVVVERSQAQGAQVERTVKQVELTPDGIELWPRSYDARWSRPIEIVNGRDKEDIAVRVVGLVLQAYLIEPPEASPDQIRAAAMS